MKSICSPPTAYCLLPTAYCLLHFREAGWRGLFAGSPGQDVTADTERKNQQV